LFWALAALLFAAPLRADVKADIEFAYQALERAMKDRRYEDGLALCRLAMALEPRNPDHAYNAACCEARRGQVEAALAYLEQAVKLGFQDVEVLKNDEDLASLREQPRFKRAVADAARSASPAGRAEADMRALSGRWTSQSMRNDYDNGSFDRGAGQDYTPLYFLTQGEWRYGTQGGKVTISDVTAADLAFMDFKPTDKPENLPKRKFELHDWAGDRAMGFWRVDDRDGTPYRIVLHFRVREPRPGLATWIRSRASD
jgi:tetratricopeptide (TPR) repeat protein